MVKITEEQKEKQEQRKRKGKRQHYPRQYGTIYKLYNV
jgi:hypothetical protein